MTTRGKKTNGRPLRRAVGVVRISKNRSEETSTATQEERIRAYCAGQGLEVVEIVPDVGRSAFKESRSSRPGLRRARTMVRTGAADVLVVWKIDRAARNVADLLELIRELEADGGAFASVTEQFETGTAFGRAVVTIVAALAELESAQKSERAEVWHGARRASGATPTGWTPYGYRRESKNELVIDPDEAATIRLMVDAVLEDESLRSLAGRLNVEHPRDNGRPFTSRTVKLVLTNPTIAALRRAEDGVLLPSTAWEPIIDRVTFEKVGAVLAEPQRRTSPGNERRWLLAGLATCGRDDCGGVMGSRPSIRGPCYACRICQQSIGAVDTDTAIERLVLDLLDRPTWRRLRSRGGRRVDTTVLEAELAELARRHAVDEITFAEWDIMRDGIMRKLADAAAEPLDLPDVDDPRAAWPGLSLEARRLIVAAALPKIEIVPSVRPKNRFDDTRIVIPPPG